MLPKIKPRVRNQISYQKDVRIMRNRKSLQGWPRFLVAMLAIVLCEYATGSAAVAAPVFTSAVELLTVAGTPAEHSQVDTSRTDPVSTGYGAAGTLGGAVRWDSSGAANSLALPVGTNGYVYVYGINNVGQVVGTVTPGRAVRWEVNGAPTLLAPPGPNAYAFAAYGINNLGQAVGQGGDLQVGDRAVRWAADGSGTFLGEVPGMTTRGSSLAYNISDAGLTVGYAELSAGGIRRAVRWAADGSASLLGLTPGQSGSSFATGINNAGEAAGYAYDSSVGNYHAVRWAADGSATLLGEVPGHIPGLSQAWGITDSGLTAGYAYLPDLGFDRAVIWDAAGNASSLQDLMADGNTWIFSAIEGIDANADMIRVLAIGSKNGGPVNYYLVTSSIPEPASAVIMAIAILALLARRWASRGRPASSSLVPPHFSRCAYGAPTAMNF